MVYTVHLRRTPEFTDLFSSLHHSRVRFQRLCRRGIHIPFCGESYSAGRRARLLDECRLLVLLNSLIERDGDGESACVFMCFVGGFHGVEFSLYR